MGDPPTDTCPTCGSTVVIRGDDEDGTLHYEPASAASRPSHGEAAALDVKRLARAFDDSMDEWFDGDDSSWAMQSAEVAAYAIAAAYSEASDE